MSTATPTVSCLFPCRFALAATVLVAGLMQVPPANAQTTHPTPDTRLAQASRLLASGDTDGALRLASSYLDQHRAEVRARVLVARIHIERDELDAAYLQLQRALLVAPRDVDALYYMGLVAGRLAAVAFENLAEKAPNSARVHQLQAETFEAQENRADAEASYEAALRANPALFDALLGLAKLKRIRLACDDAILLYEKAEALRPTFEGAFGLGVCHSYLQNDDRAATHFEQAIARDSKAAIAWEGLGTSLVKLHRSAEGIAKLQHAIALEPGMASAQYALGLAYQSIGDTTRAQEAFRLAEQLRSAH
jgi:tetratricopeptide (TPR) repeat protein